MAFVEFVTDGRTFRDPIDRLSLDTSLTDLEGGGIQEVLLGVFKTIDVDANGLHDATFNVRVDTGPGVFGVEVRTDGSA